ncbi:MAG: chromosome segregation SMC family protein [Candidatus Veblenbacteria bacterium]|nr:chromosome segregation SMC family protein [Candidatus Veblenbacteria bacterium]
MYLQKLEIQGFKSFAHKTTLEFNRQLTAIVGPNGSGKSNITDAIRWVLGEQSLKLLRGKRAEDVIFAGSDLKSRLGMAEVSLHLNNEDSSAPIDYAEVVITRRVFRDGQSEYLLNQSPVRLQDIQLLLARANFGQKTYSVIGQGMVDSILLSSPSERKEFFEEATGVKQYQLKREQSITKLLVTYDNLEQAATLLREIEPRLKTLTRQVKRLERREELESEVRELQKLYYRYRYHDLERKRSVAAASLQELRTHASSHQVTASKLTTKLTELERNVVGGSQLRELETKQRDLRHRLGELTKQQAYAQAQAEIAHLKRGQGELVLLEQRRAELTEEAKRYRERTAEIEHESKSLSARLSGRFEEQTRLTGELERYQGEGGSDWLESELGTLSQEQAEVRRKLTVAVNLSEVKATLAAVQQIEERLLAVLKRLRRMSGSGGEEIAKLMSVRDRAIEEVAALKAELKGLEREQASVASGCQRAEQALFDLTARLQSSGAGVSNKETVQNDLAGAEVELGQAEAELLKVRGERDSRSVEVFDLQRELAGLTEEQRRLEQESHGVELELARLETRLEDLEREMAQEVPPELAHSIKEEGEVQILEEGETALELQKLKHQLELTGGIEPEVLTEYQQTKTRYDFISTQTEDLTTAVASLDSVIRDLDATIEKKFLVSFKAIDEKFTQYFKVLFGGGKAQLILQRGSTSEAEEATEEEAAEGALPEEPRVTPSAKEKFLRSERVRASLFAGVEIRATPPGKKLSSITALSGGEKALSSIALICSIISHNPSPFVALDEVDAALDEANSERFAAILDSLMTSTQFITVTHNRATMKRAAILYGVTMGEDGVSKLLSVKFDEAKEMAGKGKGKSKG